MEIEKPTLISLFTGAGGLDIGLEQAGFKTLVANEIGPHACETLRQNQVISRLPSNGFNKWFSEQLAQRCYKGRSSTSITELQERLKVDWKSREYLRDAVIVEKDIREFSSQEALALAKKKSGEIDLIAGGPPCQPFSRAGKRESVNTDTGKLFKDFVRMVGDIKPRWFIFENVKGLTLTKTPIALLACAKCGNKTLLDFSEWEAVQENEDLKFDCRCCKSKNTSVVWENKSGGSLDIILQEFRQLGYLCRHSILNAADFGAPQSRERLIIVGSRYGEPFEWPAPTHRNPASLNELTLFDNNELKPWPTVRETLWPGGHWRYGKLGNKAVLWVKNVVRPHDEPVTWSLDRISPTIGAHQGAKLAIAPFGVPGEQIYRQQWHTLGRRQGDTDPVFVEHEYLTDLELLKLQTLPENWYLYGTRMERAFQIGNAVPPGLAYAVGISIIKSMAHNNPGIKKELQTV